MKVKAIQVLVEFGAGGDRVSLTLDATTPYPKMQYEAFATVDTARGYGVAWAAQNFPGFPIDIINAQTGARSRA